MVFFFFSALELDPSVQESENLPPLNRTARIPSISILLTIDDKSDKGNQIMTINVDDDEDSYEIKRKIGKRLMKKLVRIGDVDRKPNFHNSDESGCQKQMDSKYDELMTALNGIVNRALQNDANRIVQTASASGYNDDDGDKTKSPTVRRSTTPTPIVSDDGTIDNNESSEERLYKYFLSIENQLSKLIKNSQREKSKSQPMKRYNHRSARQMDYDGLARDLLKGIGLDVDDQTGHHFDRDSEEEYKMIQKYPIEKLSQDVYTDDLHSDEYEDINVPDEMTEFSPMRNLTKRNSLWSRENSNKLIESLRNRLRLSRDSDPDYCVNCRRRMRRSAHRKTSKAKSTTKTTTAANSTTETTTAANSSTVTTTAADPDVTTTVEYLLHFENKYGVDSEEGYATEAMPETTTASPVSTTTEGSDNQSTLEPSVTSNATEPSITTPSNTQNSNNPAVGANTDKLTISKNGIQVPLRLIRDSNGRMQFILDRKAICGNCRCKCRRRSHSGQNKKDNLFLNSLI